MRNSCRQRTLVVAAVISMLGAGSQAYGGSVLRHIQDDNSRAEFELGDTGNPDQRGQVMWNVDGIGQIFQQWFWFRVGDTGRERSIEDNDSDADGGPMILVAYGDADTDGDGDKDALFVQYEVDTNVINAPQPFSVEVVFRLDGGPAGSGVSDIQEQIRIINTGQALLDLHFFQYVNFDLAETPNDDIVELINANTVEQTDGAGLMTAAETVVSPKPDSFQLGTGLTTRNSLDDLSPTNFGSSPTLVTGDVTWSFQWDLTIPSGSTALITKDKAITMTLIPLPTAVWPGMGTLALLGIVRWWHRRRYWSGL